MRVSFEELTGMRVDFTNNPALILAGASGGGVVVSVAASMTANGEDEA
jgi:hypothetical protein